MPQSPGLDIRGPALRALLSVSSQALADGAEPAPSPPGRIRSRPGPLSPSVWGSLSPRRGLRTCPATVPRPLGGWEQGATTKGCASPGPRRRCETPVMGFAARAPTAGKGFSSGRGNSRAGLERAAGRERCLQHGKEPAARGRRCPWANRSDQSMVAGSNGGFTTGEVGAGDLISAVQTEVRETLQDGCLPPPSFLIGKS